MAERKQQIRLTKNPQYDSTKINTSPQNERSNLPRSTIQRETQKNEKYFYLPPIDNYTKKYAFLQPSSILTRFVEDKANQLIKDAKEIVPVKEIRAFSKDESLKTLPNDVNKNKSIDFSQRKNKKKATFFITGNNNNENTSIYNYISCLSEPNDINDENFGLNYLKPKKKNNFNITSMSIDRKIKENAYNALLPKYRRVRMFQPIISKNWKFNNGLRVTIGSKKESNSSNTQDIEYQSRVIHDEFKLLQDNYLNYKTKVINMNNYYEIFESMSLISKVNYNKSLEETIGILYLLPQLLLAEFYSMINNFSGIGKPNPEKFKEKYIFDECKALKHNNSLLIEVYEYFNGCYEVYSTLIREVNDMVLKVSDFNSVICCLEKARYNLNYLASSSKNASKNLDIDLNYIRKLNNLQKHQRTISKSIDIADKMSNQLCFKKNDEKQRKLRIEGALNNKDQDDSINKNKSIDTGIVIKNSPDKKREFNSIVKTKLMEQLMKHMKKDAKQKVSTQRINLRIEGEFRGEDDEENENHKVVKINF